MKKRFFVKDHSVSKEEFELIYDDVRKLYRTHPQPLEQNLDKYYDSEDYISHTDTKRNMFEKVYQLIKQISLHKKYRLIKKHSFDKQILDVGCGTGDFLNFVKDKGWMVMGIEPNDRARELANLKLLDVQIQPFLTDLSNDQKFDIITLWHVLEHLPNLEEQISKLGSLLKDNGRLIVAVPNYKSDDAKHYGTNWAGFDVPRHLWHFSEDSIKYIFKQHGLEIEEIRPLIFDSFYVSLLSEKYKTGKANVLSAFWRGLVSNLKAMRSGEYSSLIYILTKSEN